MENGKLRYAKRKVDLRLLPAGLSSFERVNARRAMIEQELDVDLSSLAVNAAQLGHSEEKNCENMFGAVPIPVGLAGPLSLTLSNGEETTVHLPLATTEGALVASVNRGCKALRGVQVNTTSKYHGVTRSIAFRLSNQESARPNGPLAGRATSNWIEEHESEWKSIGETTSSHLKILGYEIDEKDDHLFLTIAADTDEAMGMNMVTIAAQAIGAHIEKSTGVQFITVASNIDSDKKPSVRTHTKGRGYEVFATCTLQTATITEILKTTPEAMLATAKAKLELGSDIAGAIGRNCHAANVIAALYLATGQDAAHVVEGSLTDTIVSEIPNSKSQIPNIQISVRLPALLLGIRGGGTTLPAQKQCLNILLGKQEHPLHPCRRFAEIIAGAVLAGEISLLAAQSSHTLAKAHAKLAR